jgi:vacuolar-type H+-ATPase subunit I/STV1
MTFKMNGFPVHSGTSPAKQKGILAPKSKLRKTESKDTHLYKGTNKAEKIADLEDRIGFLREDLNEGGTQPGQNPENIKRDIASLQRELNMIRKTAPTKKIKEEKEEEEDPKGKGKLGKALAKIVKGGLDATL